MLYCIRMNVLLGADSLTLHRSGVGRMTLEIARQVCQMAEVDALRLLVNGQVCAMPKLDAMPDHTARLQHETSPSKRLAMLPGARAARDWLVRARIERAAARLQAANNARVIYHEPNMIAKPFRGPTVVTFNDLSWLEHPGMHPSDRIEWIGRRLPATLRQATRIVAISRFTAEGVASRLGVLRSRIDVVPLAPSTLFRPVCATKAAPVLAKYGLQDRRFVLSVSTLEPRKNFDGLLRAWLRMPTVERRSFPLVIVGQSGWGTVLADTAAQAAGNSGLLRVLGPVPDAELAMLYARCAAFAYVSFYEGFGLPLLEAMASGAAVLTSSTTACAETAGGAALTVDPHDEDAISAALRVVVADDACATRLRQAGLARAADYTWSRTAALLVATWTRALDET